MKLNRSLSFVVLSLACPLLYAQDGEKSLNVQIATDNVFRGVVMTNNLVLQSSFALSPRDGTRFMFWSSFDMEGSGGLDDIRFSFEQDVNAVALTGKFGATRFQRKNGFASTTEVYGQATLPLVGITVAAFKDIDVHEGLYFRATKNAPLPSFSLGGISAGLKMQSWLGYSDRKHAGFYYGHSGAGLADLGGRMTASFGVSNGTVSTWVQASTFLDADYNSPGGGRAAFTYGASFGMKF